MSGVLLAVAHGSRDPAAQQCVLSLTSRVARSAGGVTVRTAFVQNAQPSLADGLADYVERILRNYLADRTDGEQFAPWARRTDDGLLQ